MTTPQWPTAEPDDPQPWPPRYQHPYPPYPNSPYPPYPPPPNGPYPPYQHQPYPGPYGHPYPPQPYPPAPPPYPPAQQPPAEPGTPPPHRWGFGAFLLAEAVFLLASLVVPAVAILPYALRDSGAMDDGAPLPGPVLLAALAVPQLMAAAVGLLATKLRGNGPVVDLRLKFGRRDVGIGVACGLAGLIPTFLIGALWVYLVGEDDASSAVGEVFDGIQLPVVLAVLVFIDIWLIAPICEEILYRGLLWGAAERREWNRWVILGVTTVVFALAHLEPLRAPLLLFIGLPIGVARMLSGRLVAPVIAHQINNFLPALGLMLLLLGHPIAS